ncbi:MAG: NifB/NifX family molybdenum-iron cluster-binding protein [Prolixibacteraceae bacterium]|jgi:predicted Fe-Mo cluster-binding NifX family protein|nr:NifB/NifX family molybdenum-iron cluster-binding protein [Prolixibacteraceae bacterium]
MEKERSATVIRFAFAVNHYGNFEARHFGDADKYLIYEWSNGELVILKEVLNSFKNHDENPVHGLRQKGLGIINLLKDQNVNVLVSKQFGKNIQMVNQYFVPVIVSAETRHEAVPVLTKHIKWIEDELNNKPKEFKLFAIRKGVLKTTIKTNT